jgi:O-acetyl-ADP-ribose deacetylase (regulator of RNase III)
MIIYRKGDLFASGLRAIAHGVNCQGVMGAGIAAGFRARWPDMYDAYRAACKAGALQPGDTMRWDVPGLTIWNLATQRNPGRGASTAAIRAAMDRMVGQAQGLAIRQIGIPKIGCGIGGLDWQQDVRPVLARYDHLPVDLVVYEFTSPRKLSETQQAVLSALHRLGAHGDGNAVSARETGRRTGQSSDGAAYTLRSLVRRELVSHGYYAGDMYGYRLTDAGLAEVVAERARREAKAAEARARWAPGS